MYTVFARKWRPQTFEEVIGQPHITNTLKNAIRLNRVAHAYLFSGPRGVGKTSVARILAKALNCKKGPTEIPCNKCDNCLEISAGRSMDVLEIDGASNRRIDDIREIGENVKFTPASSLYKIYIIDEVHMLTKEAFNALLKTLEEPPRHVKFLFATTEPEKIIDTIVSRCQHFEYRRIDTIDIVKNLKNILSKENLNIKEEILFDIARAAEGGMRDALSLLDQIVSYCDSNVNKEDVELILGLAGYDTLCDFLKLIFTKNTADALIFVDNLVKKGKDVFQLLISLINYVRELILLKITNLDSLIELTKDEKKKSLDLINNVSLEKLIFVLDMLIELETKMKRHTIPRIPFEVTLMKLSHTEDLHSLKEILAKLDQGVISSEQGRDTSRDTAAPCHRDTVYNVPTKAAASSTVVEQSKHLSQAAAPAQQSAPKIITKITPDMPLGEKWRCILDNIRKIKMPLAVNLVKGKPTDFDGNKMTIVFNEHDNFCKESVERDTNLKIIKDTMAQLFDKPIDIKFVIKEKEEIKKEVKHEPVKQEVSNRELLENPVVKKTLEVFGGRVVDIK